MSRSQKVLAWMAIALVVAAALMTLGAFWFWAVFGMSEPVGIAWVATVTVTFFGAIALGTAAGLP